MAKISRRLVPSEFLDDPVLRAAIQRSAQMDIAARKELRDLRRKIDLLGHRVSNSSSGLRMATELRRFWLEYFERFLQHGPHSLPSSFNVIEAFLEFEAELFTFALRPENEHILAFGHYLDWYTAGGFPDAPGSLVDIMDEGLIYSYDFVLSSDRPLLRAGSSKLSIAGISLVRHGDELSVLLLAGEDPPVLAEHSDDAVSASGKEALRPAAKLSSEDRMLEGFPSCSRVLLATRFDLSSSSSDVRYLLVDLGNSYQIATDDYDAITRAFRFEPFDPRLTKLREAQAASLARYADLFSASASLMYLPAFFLAQSHNWHDTEFLTELGIEIEDPKTKRSHREMGGRYLRPRRRVRCLTAPYAATSAGFSVRPPELEFASEGYWKALPPSQFGTTPDGHAIVGKTWVKRTEAWESSTPAEFLAQRATPTRTCQEYVYVARSPSHESDLYKVGMTTRDVPTRLSELSASTAAPLPFETLARWPVADAAAAEAEVHDALAQYRVSPRREFFHAPLSTIIQTIDRVLAR